METTSVLVTLVSAWLAAAAAEAPATVVHATDSPVRIDRAIVLTTAGAPPLVVYAAANRTEADLDQFTVMVFVFDAKGVLKARQTAPGRRGLEAGETKYSAIVLDGSPIELTDRLVIGVNQAARVGSDTWWRADLQSAAEAAVAPR